MSELDHPFKAEVQAVREIIKSVNHDITEEVKWNAPSFSYKGHMATFNLWAKTTFTSSFTTARSWTSRSGFSRAITRTGEWSTSPVRRT